MKQLRDEKGRFCKKPVEEKIYAEGFKAFNSDLTCRKRHYKENSVFEEPDKCMCKSGMHFCEKPEDLLFYYPLVDFNQDPIVVAPVTALAPCDTDGIKSVTTKLHIGQTMGLKSFVESAVYSIENNKDTHRVEGYKRYSAVCDDKTRLWSDISLVACTGNCAEACSCFDNNALSIHGKFNKAACTGTTSRIFVIGDANRVAVSGDNSSVAVGSESYNTSIAVSGKCGEIASASPSDSIAVSGAGTKIFTSGDTNWIAVSGGIAYIKATGDRSRVAACGNFSTIAADAHDSIAAALGKYSQVRGKRGTMLICVEFTEDGTPKATAWGIVDGVNIKEDTWYTCKNGKLVEV